MSKTTQYRYEVGSEGYGVIDHTRTFKEAVTLAQNWIEREKSPAYIFDRMAHSDKPKLYDVRKCDGEAHSNPWIDHCFECAPYWGVNVRAKSRTIEAASELGEGCY